MDVGLVCDACSALTPIGVPQCARCGEPVALDPRTRKASEKRAALAKPNGIACPKCGSNIPSSSKFCQTCGTKAPAVESFDVDTRVGPRADPAQPPPKPRSTLFFGGAMQAARAKLTL